VSGADLEFGRHCRLTHQPLRRLHHGFGDHLDRVARALLEANGTARAEIVVDAVKSTRAELHDRITAPLYPLAFVIMTYAYLGAPRTTRQSRTMSLLGAIGAVAALRGIGFVGMIAGVHTPVALVLPYIALVAGSVLGYLAISRGVIIEPPPAVTNLINAITERFAQRAGTAARQAP